MYRSLSSLLISFPFLAAIGATGITGFASTALPSADTPILTGGFQRLYEDDFATNIPFDGFAQTAYTALTLVAFGQASADVVVAEQDWIFTAEEFYEPAAPSTFAATLAATRAALQAHGITLVPVVVPDKTRVYSDLLPRSRGADLEARYAGALATMEQLGFIAVDLAATLADASGTAQTFMRTDTHWSPLGAEVAAETLAMQTGLEARGTSQFETT